MTDKDSQARVLDVVRRYRKGEMTDADVVRWAEQMMSTGNVLGNTTPIHELALLSIVNDNSSKVTALLEELVSEVVDFTISTDDLEKASQLSTTIVRDRNPESINQDNCMTFVLGQCPQLAEELAHVREASRGDEPGLYNELSCLIDLILDSLKSEGPELQAALECLEWLFILGTHEIREAATLGIVEGVTNTLLSRKQDLSPFVDRLLPLSRKAHEDLERFWGTDHRLP